MTRSERKLIVPDVEEVVEESDGSPYQTSFFCSICATMSKLTMFFLNFYTCRI